MFNNPSNNNPNTGKPSGQKVITSNEFDALIQQYEATPEQNPVRIAGSGNLSPEDYVLRPDLDLNEQAAQQQSGWEQATSAIAGGLMKTGLKLAQMAPAIASPVAHIFGYQQNAADDAYNFFKAKEDGVDDYLPIYTSTKNLDTGDVSTFFRDTGAEILSSIVPGIAMAKVVTLPTKAGALGMAIVEGQVNAYHQANDVYKQVYEEMRKTVNPKTGQVFTEDEARLIAIEPAKWNYTAQSMLGLLNYASTFRTLSIVNNTAQKKTIGSIANNIFGAQAISGAAEEVVEFGLTETAKQMGRNIANPKGTQVSRIKAFMSALSSEEGGTNAMMGYLGEVLGGVAGEFIAGGYKDDPRTNEIRRTINGLDNINASTNTSTYSELSQRVPLVEALQNEMQQAYETGDYVRLRELVEEENVMAQFSAFSTNRGDDIRSIYESVSNQDGGKSLNIGELKSMGIIQSDAQISELVNNATFQLGRLNRNQEIYNNLRTGMTADAKFAAFSKLVEEANLVENIDSSQKAKNIAIDSLAKRMVLLDPGFDVSSLAGQKTPQEKIEILRQAYPEIENSMEYASAQRAIRDEQDLSDRLSEVREYTSRINEPDFLEFVNQNMDDSQLRTMDFLNGQYEDIESMQVDYDNLPEVAKQDPRVTAKVGAVITGQTSRPVGPVSSGKTDNVDSEAMATPTEGTDTLSKIVGDGKVTNAVHPEDVEVMPDNEPEEVFNLFDSTNQVVDNTTELRKLENAKIQSGKLESSKANNTRVGYETSRTSLGVTDTAVMEFGEFRASTNNRYIGALYDNVTGKPVPANNAVQFDFDLLNSTEVGPGSEVELEYMPIVQIGTDVTDAIVVKYQGKPITYVAKSETSKTLFNGENFDYLKGQIEKGLTRTTVVAKQWRPQGDVVRVPYMSMQVFANEYTLGDIEVKELKRADGEIKGDNVRKMSDSWYKRRLSDFFLLVHSPNGDKIPVSLRLNNYGNLDNFDAKVGKKFIREINTIMQSLESMSRQKAVDALNQVMTKYTPSGPVLTQLTYTPDGGVIGTFDRTKQGLPSKQLSMSRYDELVDLLKESPIWPDLDGLDWRNDNIFQTNVYPIRPIKDSQLQISLDTKLPKGQDNLLGVQVEQKTLSDGTIEETVTYVDPNELVSPESTEEAVEQVSDVFGVEPVVTMDQYMNDPMVYNEAVAQIEAAKYEASTNEGPELTQLEQDIQTEDSFIQDHEIFGQSSWIKDKRGVSLRKLKNGIGDLTKSLVTRTAKLTQVGKGAVVTNSGVWEFDVPDHRNELLADGTLATDSELYNVFYRKLITDLNLAKNLKVMSESEFKNHYRMTKKEARGYRYFASLDNLGITEDNVSKSNPDVYDLINDYYNVEKEETTSIKGLQRDQYNKYLYDSVFWRMNTRDLAKFYEMDILLDDLTDVREKKPNPTSAPLDDSFVTTIEEQTETELYLLGDRNLSVRNESDVVAKGPLRPETLFEIVSNIEDFRYYMQSEVDKYGYNGSVLSQIVEAGYNLQGFNYRQNDIEQMIYPEDTTESTDFLSNEQDMDTLNLC